LAFQHASHRKSFWGPRALAVISCALALLAAQPVMAQSSAPASKPVLAREIGMFGGANLLQASTAREAERTTVRARRQDSILASARRLHVLATVEIFHRLLMAELRGNGEQTPAPTMCFVPVCIEVLAPASLTKPIPSSEPTIQPVAQAYAIAHCLLAPPAL